jgi:hypothetical protein
VNLRSLKGLILATALAAGLIGVARPATASATAPPSSLHFGSLQNVDPYHDAGKPTSISCPAATPWFCMTVDSSGSATAEMHGGWHRPVPLFSPPSRHDRPVSGFGDLTAVSCASQLSCTAVGDAGISFTYNGTDWGGVKVIAPTDDSLTSVSCPTSSLCVAVDNHGQALVKRSGVWSGPKTIDADGGGLIDVSCSDAVFCMALDHSGDFTTWDGTSWAAPVHPPWTDPAQVVSCVGSSWCIAVTAGAPYIYSGGKWTESVSPGASSFIGLSCVSTTWCVAITTQGRIAAFTGSSWESPSLTTDATFVAISCNTTALCTAIDASGAAHTYDTGAVKWSSHSTVFDPQSGLEDISCLTVKFCAASGRNGTTTVYGGVRWGPNRSAYPGDLVAVSCLTVRHCLAIDKSTGQLIDHFEWQWAWPQRLPGMATRGAEPVAISCTAVFCAVVDSQGESALGSVPTRDSEGRWSPKPTHLSTADHVSCASPSFCVATSTGNQVALYNGTTWSAPITADRAPGARIDSISCPAVDLCWATDSDGRSLSFNGTSWSAGPKHVVGTGISCPSAGFCVTYASNWVKTLSRSGKWSAPVRVLPTDPQRPGNVIISMSCASTTYCLALDSYNDVTIGRS